MADLQKTLDLTVSSMILSTSGWRKVFAMSGDGEDRCGEISEADRLVCTAVALSFYRHIGCKTGKSPVLVARDARPTGKAICNVICSVLASKGMNIAYAGICSAPEIMAQSVNPHYCGFVYVSASHNPIGHNGIKFGRRGGVLPGEEAKPLIETFGKLVADAENLRRELDESREFTVQEDGELKKRCLKDYAEFVKLTTCPDGDFSSFAQRVASRKLGIVADLNGSARCQSIDRTFLSGLGIKTCFVNDTAGEVAHGIVPEGDNLKTCRDLLEKMHSQDSCYILGYVPDNDGDRGNLVWCDDEGKAHILMAQEVFALCVKATLEYHKSIGTENLALAVNGPTSMRTDEIAGKCGAKVFRAEVGEANAVSLGDFLRRQGYNVPILGEGSNGGNITYPARVRDPMNTLMCLVRLVCKRKTLAEEIASLPVYTTTNALSPQAILHLKTKNYPALKKIYEDNFETQWKKHQTELASYGITHCLEFQTDGIVERQERGNCTSGGLKMAFFDNENRCLAYIWMRPSGTEPLFRILADVKGDNQVLHKTLIDWQRDMILTAEKELLLQNL